MKKKVSVIITNYNEGKFVESCLNNLKDSYENLEVIVKNQGSSDSSPELIKNKYPWVKYMEGENDGLSLGYNKAVKVATGDYYLFLGMDAQPSKGSIDYLVSYMEENPDIGLATLKLVLKDGNMDIDCHRAFPTPFNSIMKLSGMSRLFPKSKIFNGFFLPHLDLSKPHEIDNCISHFMFVRKNAFDSVNGFDEDYFLWGEDIDFCYRLKVIKGWKIMFIPKYTCSHWKGGSIGIRNTTRHLEKRPLKHRLKMQRMSTEAMSLFMRKHYMDKYPKILLYFMFFSAKVLGNFRVLVETFR